jgi:ankyrin repeat protein
MTLVWELLLLRAMRAVISTLSRAKEMNQTALFYAARQGHAETIEFLLSKGADPNVVDTNGETALLGCQ